MSTSEAPMTVLDAMALRDLTGSPFPGNPDLAFAKAMELVRTELNVQMRMWGKNNERADSVNREMMDAAMAQLDLVKIKSAGLRSREATKIAHEDFYPQNWDGFRDYGTDSANLAVAAAYLVSEIARLLLSGKDYERAARDQSYTTASPNMSSAEAATLAGPTDVV